MTTLKTYGFFLNSSTLYNPTLLNNPNLSQFHHTLVKAGRSQINGDGFNREFMVVILYEFRMLPLKSLKSRVTFIFHTHDT